MTSVTGNRWFPGRLAVTGEFRPPLAYRVERQRRSMAIGRLGGGRNRVRSLPAQWYGGQAR